jgi:long-chain acyl-CoA synthetase
MFADHRTLHPPTAQRTPDHAAQQVRPSPSRPGALQLGSLAIAAGGAGAPSQLGLREGLNGHDRRVRLLSRPHHPIRSRPSEPDHMARRDVIRIEQGLVLRPPAEERIAGVARVGEDRPNGAGLPPIGEPVTILIRAPRRRTRDPVPIEATRDCPVTLAVEVLREDPPHHLGRRVLRREHTRVLAWGRPGLDGVESFEDAVAAADSGEPRTDLPPLPSLLYTSGTSGRPKGTLLPRSMFPGGATMTEFVANLRTGRYYGFGPHLVVGPMYHTGPLGGLRTLATGTPVVVLGRFDPEALLSAIDRFRVATMLMVPTHFARLLALPAQVRSRYDVSSVEMITHTGSKCPVEVKRAMIDWFGPVLLEAYGSTEAGTVALIDSTDWLAHPGSVGRAAPNYVLSIRDESGRELPTGQEGLVCVRTLDGPGPAYHGDPEKTADSYLVPGEFVIGEIGYLDEERYLYLTDRHSDIVVSGGVNIFPAEAEAVLAAHPDVADVAVIGIPSAEMGEDVHALVVPRSPGLDGDALIGWCRERLTHYKCPRSVELVAELPRSEMGKLDKRALRAYYAVATS